MKYLRTDEAFPHEMSKIVPEVRNDRIIIDHFTVTEHDIFMASIGGDHEAHTDIKKTYARLRVKEDPNDTGWTLMMTDTDMERASNVHFVAHAHGRVLVAGLGLGLILHRVLENPDVTDVTVIEKYQEVIDAVGPTLPHQGKLHLICADIDTWRPALSDTPFNVIYFDIWPNRSTENIPHANKLHRMFRKYLSKDDPERFIDSWYLGQLRYMKRRENSSRGYW